MQNLTKQQANEKVQELCKETNEIAYILRQLIYTGKANETMTRKICGLSEISGEITFLSNYFEQLNATIGYKELVKKAENYYKHATSLKNKIEKELEEQA